MLHGCRQLVSWDVWLIPLTGATLVFNYLFIKIFINFLLLKILSMISWRKVEQSQVNVTLMNWATHVLQWKLQKVTKKFNFSLISKNFPSSDCKLQLAYMKLESLVIANQHVAVNMLLGLVHTARHMQRINFAWRFNIFKSIEKLVIWMKS